MECDDVQMGSRGRRDGCSWRVSRRRRFGRRSWCRGTSSSPTLAQLPKGRSRQDLATLHRFADSSHLGQESLGEVENSLFSRLVRGPGPPVAGGCVPGRVQSDLESRDAVNGQGVVVNLLVDVDEDWEPEGRNGTFSVCCHCLLDRFVLCDLPRPLS